MKTLVLFLLSLESSSMGTGNGHAPQWTTSSNQQVPAILIRGRKSIDEAKAQRHLPEHWRSPSSSLYPGRKERALIRPKQRDNGQVTGALKPQGVVLTCSVRRAFVSSLRSGIFNCRSVFIVRQQTGESWMAIPLLSASGNNLSSSALARREARQRPALRKMLQVARGDSLAEHLVPREANSQGVEDRDLNPSDMVASKDTALLKVSFNSADSTSVLCWTLMEVIQGYPYRSSLALVVAYGGNAYARQCGVAGLNCQRKPSVSLRRGVSLEHIQPLSHQATAGVCGSSVAKLRLTRY